MRILFVTAYYPPCDYGWGYMRVCEQVADGLYARGHVVQVLTSTYRHGAEFKPYPVQRQLHIDPDWLRPESALQQFFVGRRQRERADVALLRQTVQTFGPDVIFVWHAHGLSRRMLQVAEGLPGVQTVYYFANYLPELPDEYVQYWSTRSASRVVRLVKGPVSALALAWLRVEGKPIRLAYRHSISVSQYVRDRLRPLIGDDAVVIPNGISVAQFHHPVRVSQSQERLRCVIAGRLAPEKGIHTVLEALGRLHRQDELQCIHLTIIGGGGPADYRQQLEALIQLYQLADFVTLAEPVPAAQMPAVFAQHHLLLLPSEWDEPLSCTMLEAMSSGLMVVGTTTGGSGEALWHGRTGLVFPAGDADALAAQLRTALHNRDQLAQLALTGQQEIETNFNIDISVARIEAYLQARVA